MKTGIRKIYLVKTLGSTPARINRKTGELYISREKWDDLDPNTRLFILLHEAGHIDQQTRNEIAADNYAFQAYAQAGKPLSKAITALTRLLHFQNPQHYDRVNSQVRRAFAYDYYVNGNPKAHPDNVPELLPELNYSGDATQTAQSWGKTYLILAGIALVILAAVIYQLNRKK